MEAGEKITMEAAVDTAPDESAEQVKSSTTSDQPSKQPKKLNPVWEYFQKYQGTITITDPNLM